MDETDRALTTEEAAEIIGVSANTLKTWRHREKGPPWLKYGDARNATVRYRESSVRAWMREQEVAS